MCMTMDGWRWSGKVKFRDFIDWKHIEKAGEAW